MTARKRTVVRVRQVDVFIVSYVRAAWMVVVLHVLSFRGHQEYFCLVVLFSFEASVYSEFMRKNKKRLVERDNCLNTEGYLLI